MIKNIKIIHSKLPSLVSKHLKIFYCKFNEPLYIKIEKINILVLLANEKNFEQILTEFQEYIQEADQDYVTLVIKSL